MIRTAAKKDANHAEIVRKLRQIGAYVLDISQLKNCCDVIVGYRGRWVALEIKDGAKPASATQLTPGEHKFLLEAGIKAPVRVVYSFQEALSFITLRE